jgi:hypothetical protein
VLGADRVPAALLAVLDDVVDLEHGRAGASERAWQLGAPFRDVRVTREVEAVQGQRLGHAVEHGEGHVS